MWGAGYSKGGQPAPVATVDIDRWDAGFARKDRGGGRVEVVGDLTADPVPEGVYRLGGTVVGD